jgi:hypothetical protein
LQLQRARDGVGQRGRGRQAGRAEDGERGDRAARPRRDPQLDAQAATLAREVDGAGARVLDRDRPRVAATADQGAPPGQLRGGPGRRVGVAEVVGEQGSVGGVVPAPDQLAEPGGRGEQRGPGRVAARLEGAGSSRRRPATPSC